jgi:hypothetical protein
LNPCAGDCEAIATLRKLWFGTSRSTARFGSLDASIIAVKLEKQQYHRAFDRLADTSPADVVLEADAFQL